jgi:hypothetical protein
MQDNNRFFQFVWRLNALAIAGVAVVAGLLGLYGLISIFDWETRDREVTDLLAVEPDVSRQDEVRLGYPTTIPGTQYVRVPLFREQKRDLSYYSKSSGDNTVNELYVDSSTGKSKWLFAGTDRLILNQLQTMQQLKSDQPIATSILYSLVDKDTNNDKRLSPQDVTSIGYASLDGTVYTPLLDNIGKLYSVEQVADDKVMVIYFRNGESRLITYALPNYAILVDQVLPKLESKP